MIQGLSTSDGVTRVSNSTRVTIFSDSDWTRDTLKKMMTRVTFFTEWLESPVRVVITKSLSP